MGDKGRNKRISQHLRECNACRAYIAGQINANAGALQAITFLAEIMREIHDVNSHDEGTVIYVSTWGHEKRRHRYVL